MSEQDPSAPGAEQESGEASDAARRAGQAAAEQTETRARRAFGWYRTMSFVTGTMLLVLTAEMVMKYVFGVNGYDEPGTWWTARPVIGPWVAILHGWIYVVYAATVLNPWAAWWRSSPPAWCRSCPSSSSAGPPAGWTRTCPL
jgi:integral membrane protein